MSSVVEVIFSFLEIEVNSLIAENAVQKELNETYKQINHLQKELKTLQAKYDNSANFERYKIRVWSVAKSFYRYREVENQIAIKDRELQRLITEKATLDRLVAEKEKAIDNIKKQTGIDTKVSYLINKSVLTGLIRCQCWEMNWRT